MPVDLQSLYPRLIHLMLDTVFVVDRDNQIVFVSDACEALLGYQACELIGTPITDYMHPDDLAITRASIVRVMSGQPHYDFRNRYIRKDGSIVHILWSASWSDEANARIGVARDITAQHQAEEELRFLAHHDPLTRLANRAMFNERLGTALVAARHHNHPLALLFIDINDFKDINDNHGHCIGRPNAAFQAPRQGAQHPVTHAVAVVVVDLLEVIDIEEQQGQPAVVTPGRGQGGVQPLIEHGAVGQPGQWVMIGEEAQFVEGHVRGSSGRAPRHGR